MSPYLYLLPVIVFALACTPKVEDEEVHYQETKQHLPPDQRYGNLFADVQKARIFPDGKTFADAIPTVPTDQILADYEAQRSAPDFDLKAFVDAHFDPPHSYSSDFQADTSRSVSEHINTLWPVLTRQPDEANPGTLIPLPNAYIVPGGRFGEIYYWDSYFTMLGLRQSGREDMIESMLDNFAYLIDTVGFIPNGNRTYFLSRSQPPFFAAMVNLLAEQKGDAVYEKYLPQLEKEYAFWMAEGETTQAGEAKQHVVRLEDGSLLNRYWDNQAKPRAEMYADDLETADESARPAEEVYSDLRAACESGWDFSSRWLADGETLSTIETTHIIPVDLNSLLFELENTLSKAHAIKGNTNFAQAYKSVAQKRAALVSTYCWDEELGYFQDYDWKKGLQTGRLSLAGMYPLYFGLASQDQAERSAEVIREVFLKPGGVVSTPYATGQQWDAPNGWAPLQWITISGLRKYGLNELADEIADRWIALNKRTYMNTGKLVEKYNVENMSLESGGGEYPVQDGFGWTNGVLLELLSDK